MSKSQRSERAAGPAKSMRTPAATRWGEILRAQAASGLPVATYCRQAGVPVSSFYGWRRKLRDAETLARQSNAEVPPDAEAVATPSRARAQRPTTQAKPSRARVERSAAHAERSSDHAERRPRRTRRSAARGEPSPATFAEVRMTLPTELADRHGVLELHLPGGQHIVVRPGFDRQTLRDLLATLAQCPASHVPAEVGV